MAQNNEPDILFSYPQADVINSRAPIIGDMSGQGGGKTELIGFLSGMMVNDFPEIKGFIGANTDTQLSQTTLTKVFNHWKRVFGFVRYDIKTQKDGDYVVDKIPPPHFKRFEELKSYHNTISFRNGALIFVGSLTNYMVHDGKEFGWAHLDETKDTKEEAIGTVILGRLRQYGLFYNIHTGALQFDKSITPEVAESLSLRSWAPCYIHTSPSEGGVPWLLDMFDLARHEKEIKAKVMDPYDYYQHMTPTHHIVIYSAFWNEQNLRPGFLQERLAQMSEIRALKFIYSYPFSKTGDEYFPHFYRARHVRPCGYIPGVPVSVSFDFNAVPYMTGLMGQVQYVRQWLVTNPDKTVGGFLRYESSEDCYAQHATKGTQYEVMQIRVYKDYPLASPLNSTEAVCEAFCADLDFMRAPGEPEQDVLVYGDATGRNRIVGMGDQTQYSTVEAKMLRFLPEDWLRVELTNIANMKRRDLMNRIFENKIAEVEVVIDPACDTLINDVENVKQRGNGEKDPEKDNKGRETMGHMSDALEYLVCPLVKEYMNDFS
jgi:hypothetical protein